MKILRLVSMALALFLLGGCASESYKQIKTINQLNNPIYKIGGSAETESYRIACQRFTIADHVPFGSMLQLIPALQMEKIDGAVFDRPSLDYAAALYGDLVVLPENLAPGQVAIATSYDNEALMSKVNAFIKQYREDGTYQKMYKHWIKTPHAKMPKIAEAKNPVGVLRVGTETANIPLNYLDREENLIGFNIEFAKRLALYLNMKLELDVMEYSELCAAAGTKKVDLAIASIDVTDANRNLVLFSDEYIDCPVAVMVRKEKKND